MSGQAPNYRGYRFPAEVISHAVWLYYRFTLSFRDVEDLLAQRSIIVTYETIRQWCRTFGPDYVRTLRRRRGRLGDTWHLDELFVTLNGRQQYLWRAVDEDGDVLDILVQPGRGLASTDAPAGALDSAVQVGRSPGAVRLGAGRRAEPLPRRPASAAVSTPSPAQHEWGVRRGTCSCVAVEHVVCS